MIPGVRQPTVTKVVCETEQNEDETARPWRWGQGHMPSEQPGGSSDHEKELQLSHQYFRTSLATSTDVDRNLFISLLGGKSRMPPTPRAPEIISLTVAQEVQTIPRLELQPAFAPMSRLCPEPTPRAHRGPPAPPHGWTPPVAGWPKPPTTPSGGIARRAIQGYALNGDELHRLQLAAAVHTAERLIGAPPPAMPWLIPVRPGARDSRSRWSSMAIKDPKRQSYSFITQPRYVQPKVSRMVLRATVLEGLPAFHGRLSPRRPMPGVGSPRLKPI